MIVDVCGYKYFHGDLEIHGDDGEIIFVVRDKDFILDPNIGEGSWIWDDGMFQCSCCVERPYIPFEEERCGYGSMAISMGVCPVDPCVYEIVETHKNVTVEVAKCRKCGHVELSWYRGDIYNDEKYSEDGASY